MQLFRTFTVKTPFGAKKPSFGRIMILQHFVKHVGYSLVHKCTKQYDAIILTLPPHIRKCNRLMDRFLIDSNDSQLRGRQMNDRSISRTIDYKGTISINVKSWFRCVVRNVSIEKIGFSEESLIFE